MWFFFLGYILRILSGILLWPTRQCDRSLFLGQFGLIAVAFMSRGDNENVALLTYSLLPFDNLESTKFTIDITK